MRYRYGQRGRPRASVISVPDEIGLRTGAFCGDPTERSRGHGKNTGTFSMAHTDHTAPTPHDKPRQNTGSAKISGDDRSHHSYKCGTRLPLVTNHRERIRGDPVPVWSVRQVACGESAPKELGQSEPRYPKPVHPLDRKIAPMATPPPG